MYGDGILFACGIPTDVEPGDEGLPICRNCLRAKRYCDHSHSKASRRNTLRSTSTRLNDDDPQSCLKDPEIAGLFHHYISHLAAWYDLSDANASFGKVVPLLALSNTLLFNAIIAFAAIHRSKTHAPALSRLAESFHENCVQLLIGLDDISAGDGNALAAVCLLRSYELLAEDSDPNRHLSGAYALAAVGVPDFREASLLKAGFFNYLREDITYALIHRCQLKIDTGGINIPNSALDDEDQLNTASLYLADTINKTFGLEQVGDQTPWLRFTAWKTSLPTQFMPYYEFSSENTMLTFPTIRMMGTPHVSVLQYCLVTETLLASKTDRNIEMMEQNALRLCGLAFNSDNPAVYVNSFGPMSFCCRYLREVAHQTELVRRLHAVRESTGWPVKRMVDGLKLHWNAVEH